MTYRIPKEKNTQHKTKKSRNLKRNRSSLALLSLALTLSISACGTVPTIEDNFNMRMDQELKTANYTAWDGSCSTRNPSIRIVTKPTNGTIAIRPKEMKIGSGATLGKNVFCQGRTVVGSEVFYVPNRGYKGKDEFLLESTLPGQPGASRRSVTVTVR